MAEKLTSIELMSLLKNRTLDLVHLSEEIVKLKQRLIENCPRKIGDIITHEFTSHEERIAETFNKIRIETIELSGESAKNHLFCWRYFGKVLGKDRLSTPYSTCAFEEIV